VIFILFISFFSYCFFHHRDLHSFPTRRSSDLKTTLVADFIRKQEHPYIWYQLDHTDADAAVFLGYLTFGIQQRVANFGEKTFARSEEHTSELQSRENLVCRLLLEKKK